MSNLEKTKDEILSILGYFTSIPMLAYPKTFGLGTSLYSLFPLIHVAKAIYASIFTSLIYLGLKDDINQEIAYLLCLVMYVLIYHHASGGIHHDGYIDTIDGSLAGASLSHKEEDLAQSRETTMRVMKEPTVGAIGVFMMISTILLSTVMMVTAMYVSGDNLIQFIVIESIIYMIPSLVIGASKDVDIAKDLPEKVGNSLAPILTIVFVSLSLVLYTGEHIGDTATMLVAATFSTIIAAAFTKAKAIDFNMTINGDMLGYSLVMCHLLYPTIYLTLK